MPVFACRWQNGDVSFVMAPSKETAIEQLDEVANAEGLALVAVPRFMLHLKLAENLAEISSHFDIEQFLVFDGLGEDTADVVWKAAYPKLHEVMETIWDEQEAQNSRTFTVEQETHIRAGVEAERTRVDDPKDVRPETEVGKELKNMTDMPASMVNKMVSAAAKKRLKEWNPKSRKKH